LTREASRDSAVSVRRDSGRSTRQLINVTQTTISRPIRIEAAGAVLNRDLSVSETSTGIIVFVQGGSLRLRPGHETRMAAALPDIPEIHEAAIDRFAPQWMASWCFVEPDQDRIRPHVAADEAIRRKLCERLLNHIAAAEMKRFS
jgi:hypothetical protein